MCTDTLGLVKGSPPNLMSYTVRSETVPNLLENRPLEGNGTGVFSRGKKP